MGCCVSTKKPDETTPHTIPRSSLSKDCHLQDRALVPESDPPFTPRKKPPPSLPSHPPPPPLEEETVKEVLSETPALTTNNYPKFQDHQKILRLPSFPRIEHHHHHKNNTHFEEISEISEICSVTESVSTSAMTEQSREFDEVLQQPRIIDRSPSKIRRKRSDSGEIRSRGESPVRRSGYGKEVGHSRQWNQNGGESSRRRSRSPATRTDAGAGVSRPGLSQSPSKRGVRYNGRSPTPTTSSEVGRNFEETKEGKRAVKESLEDPLVSLECFIFL